MLTDQALLLLSLCNQRSMTQVHGTADAPTHPDTDADTRTMRWTLDAITVCRYDEYTEDGGRDSQTTRGCSDAILVRTLLHSHPRREEILVRPHLSRVQSGTHNSPASRMLGWTAVRVPVSAPSWLSRRAPPTLIRPLLLVLHSDIIRSPSLLR